MASNLIRQLVGRGDGRSLAIAYQISFDLYENGTQEFLAKVMEELPTEEKSEEKPAANGDASHKPREDAAESDSLLSNMDTSNVSTVVSRTKQRSTSEDELKAYSSVRDVLQGVRAVHIRGGECSRLFSLFYTLVIGLLSGDHTRSFSRTTRCPRSGRRAYSSVIFLFSITTRATRSCHDSGI